MKRERVKRGEGVCDAWADFFLLKVQFLHASAAQPQPLPLLFVPTVYTPASIVCATSTVHTEISCHPVWCCYWFSCWEADRMETWRTQTLGASSLPQLLFRIFTLPFFWPPECAPVDLNKNQTQSCTESRKPIHFIHRLLNVWVCFVC